MTVHKDEAASPYVAAICRGERVIYQKGSIDTLTILCAPTMPADQFVLYPCSIGVLFASKHTDRHIETAIGFCFYQMSHFFRKGSGRFLLPYFTTGRLDTQKFLTSFAEDVLSWRGWQIEQNKRYKHKMLRERPELTTMQLQAQLAAYRAQHEDMIQAMVHALEEGRLPDSLPTSVLLPIFNITQ
jgi:hypothetical protein